MSALSVRKLAPSLHALSRSAARPGARIPTRAFTSGRITVARPQQKWSGQLRQLSTSLARRAANSQEAPNSQAYLNSGAIHGARDLVDVKKVLVVGSGGLSIGQAGEFDYSGKTTCLFLGGIEAIGKAGSI